MATLLSARWSLDTRNPKRPGNSLQFSGAFASPWVWSYLSRDKTSVPIELKVVGTENINVNLLIIGSDVKWGYSSSTPWFPDPLANALSDLQLWVLWNRIWPMDFVLMDLLLILVQKKYLTVNHLMIIHLHLPIMCWILLDLTKYTARWAKLSIVTWMCLWEWAWAGPSIILIFPGPCSMPEGVF